MEMNLKRYLGVFSIDKNNYNSIHAGTFKGLKFQSDKSSLYGVTLCDIIYKDKDKNVLYTLSVDKDMFTGDNIEEENGYIYDTLEINNTDEKYPDFSIKFLYDPKDKNYSLDLLDFRSDVFDSDVDSIIINFYCYFD